MFSAKEILEFAIKIEKNAETVYREAGKRTAKLEIASLLLFLAEEERRHGEWFRERRDSIRLDADEADLEKVYGTMLQDMIGDQAFSLAQVDLSRFDQVKALLELAVEFENDTILFYETLHSLIDDEDVSARLREIITEENRHIRLLSEKMTSVSTS
ncbi:MAG TPA: ferritin family protein [Syntrophobacteria bacterium]|nr:ferritin family protein [Syntrophobacteria bacterium]